MTPFNIFASATRRLSLAAVFCFSIIANLASAQTPLPSGWTAMDIGTTGPAGSNSGYVPTVTMNAAGDDIFGTTDSFRFTFETWSGDGSVVARVTTLNNTNPWAKAGVMFRASLDPGSPNASMLLTADNVCTFQARTEPGATTSHNPGDYLRVPYWVKVTRLGDTFTGYVSADGSNWTAVSSQAIVMPQQLYVGIAAASHASVQTVASFDNVDVGNGMPGPYEWTQKNLGAGSGGFTRMNGMTIESAGGDIYDSADSGVFVYRGWSGNGEFVTRVDVLTKSNDWAKAGIMLRATRDADSANAMVALTPDLGAVLQMRGVSGGSSDTYAHDWNPGVPSWIKLVRLNGQLTAYWSVDGATWNTIGSVNDTLPPALFVGFAASSHDSATSTWATFSNFSFH